MSSSFTEDISPRDVEKLEKELQQYIEQQKNLRENRSALEQELFTARQNLEAIVSQMQRCRQDIENIRAKQTALSEKVLLPFLSFFYLYYLILLLDHCLQPCNDQLFMNMFLIYV